MATNSYGYDANGTRTRLVTGGATYTNVVTLSFRVEQVMQGSSTNQAYSYDSGGRITSIIRSGVTNTLAYNASDQVTNVTIGTTTNIYIYDAAGRRVKATQTGSSERRFLVARTPEPDLESPQLIANAIGTVRQVYVYLGDKPLLRHGESDSNRRVYYLQDGMGSVIGLAPHSSPDTNNTTRLFYDGFGNTRATNGPAPTLPTGTGGDFRSQGMWLEDGTGLYHARARDYDPRTGRFLSRDPNDGGFKTLESLHPYTFANNNPYIYSDPSGEFTIIEINVAGAIQNGLQGFRTYAVNKAKQKAIDQLLGGLEDYLWNQLQRFLPLDLSKFTEIPGNFGIDFEFQAQRYICKAFKAAGIEDNYHYSVRLHNRGRKSGDGRIHVTTKRSAAHCSNNSPTSFLSDGGHAGKHENCEQRT